MTTRTSVKGCWSASAAPVSTACRSAARCAAALKPRSNATLLTLPTGICLGRLRAHSLQPRLGYNGAATTSASIGRGHRAREMLAVAMMLQHRCYCCGLRSDAGPSREFDMATNPEPQRSFLAQRAHRFIAALVFRDFRFMAFATLCSSSGAWALIVARGAWVYGIPELQGTQGLWVGLITFAAMSPRFFATPFIGYLADRFTRKTLLQWVYVLQIGQASIMAILVMAGVDNPWYVLVLAVVNGTLRSTQMTAAQSLTPNLVDRERLPNAVALNQAMQQGSRAIGPAILLVISLTVGGTAIFGSGGFSFSLQNLVVTIGTSAVVFWACAVFLPGRPDVRAQHPDGIDRGDQPPSEFLVQRRRGLLVHLQHAAGIRNSDDRVGTLRAGDVIRVDAAASGAGKALARRGDVRRQRRIRADGRAGGWGFVLVNICRRDHQPHDPRKGVPAARFHQQFDTDRGWGYRRKPGFRCLRRF